ncbi:MAG: ribosome silencing factor [Chthoniobacterales bacterium]
MARPRKQKVIPAVETPYFECCADAAVEKKAEDITILDMRGLSSFTDYFVICSGASDPQLKAIATSIRENMRERFGAKPIYEDGFPSSQWIVLDYGDVLVHIFHKDKRGYYGLENLWSDAKVIPYTEKK